MFLELIGVVIAAAFAAIVVFALNRLVGGRLPKWLMPVAAGFAMIAATISLEYSWFSRTGSDLPEGLEIAQTIEDRAVYRPWTYVKPYVGRFVAVDVGTALTNDAMPGHVLADLYFFGRWAPITQTPVLFDCVEHRRSALVDGVTFNAEGSVENPSWRNVDPTDPIMAVACKQQG